MVKFGADSSSGSPIISVGEARKLIGGLSQDMTDNQVLTIVTNLQLLAQKQMCKLGSNK